MDAFRAAAMLEERAKEVPKAELEEYLSSGYGIFAGRKVECGMLALWGEQGAVGRCFAPLDEWRKVARDVRGKSLPCGHYIAEEAPELLLEETLPSLLAAH